MVTPVKASIVAIATSPRPGLRSPKKAAGHAALAASCQPQIRSAAWLPDAARPTRRPPRWKCKARSTHGAKTQLGGVPGGAVSEGYAQAGGIRRSAIRPQRRPAGTAPRSRAALPLLREPNADRVALSGGRHSSCFLRLPAVYASPYGDDFIPAVHNEIAVVRGRCHTGGWMPDRSVCTVTASAAPAAAARAASACSIPAAAAARPAAMAAPQPSMPRAT